MRGAAFFLGVMILAAGLVPAIVAWTKGAPVNVALTLIAVGAGVALMLASSMVVADVSGPAQHLGGGADPEDVNALTVEQETD